MEVKDTLTLMVGFGTFIIVLITLIVKIIEPLTKNTKK
ncbi:putative holin-like toxin [Paenibacillus sp. A3]|nr:putative holin-like toxin [Paenibacillus sp. A3]